MKHLVKFYGDTKAKLHSLFSLNLSTREPIPFGKI